MQIRSTRQSANVAISTYIMEKLLEASAEVLRVEPLRRGLRALGNHCQQDVELLTQQGGGEPSTELGSAADDVHQLPDLSAQRQR